MSVHHCFFSNPAAIRPPPGANWGFARRRGRTSPRCGSVPSARQAPVAGRPRRNIVKRSGVHPRCFVKESSKGPCHALPCVFSESECIGVPHGSKETIHRRQRRNWVTHLLLTMSIVGLSFAACPRFSDCHKHMQYPYRHLKTAGSHPRPKSSAFHRIPLQNCLAQPPVSTIFPPLRPFSWISTPTPSTSKSILAQESLGSGCPLRETNSREGPKDPNIHASSSASREAKHQSPSSTTPCVRHVWFIS